MGHYRTKPACRSVGAYFAGRLVESTQVFRFILLGLLSNVAQTWHHLDSSKDPTPDLMLYPLAG